MFLCLLLLAQATNSEYKSSGNYIEGTEVKKPSGLIIFISVFGGIFVFLGVLALTLYLINMGCFGLCQADEDNISCFSCSKLCCCKNLESSSGANEAMDITKTGLV